MTDSRRFYDDLADLYDVIYVDWEAAMERHADAIRAAAGPAAEAPATVLDVSAGIGTQALPLAARGLSVTARDLSAGSIARLSREADARGLVLDAGVADMRALDVDGPFDLVISLDNAIAHLPDDAAILEAFREARRVTAEDGVFVASVRDYGEVDRGSPSVRRYGDRTRGGRRFDVRQEWDWIDRDQYVTTLVVEELADGGRSEVLRTTTTCHAVGIPQLLSLMGRAGFDARVASDVDFFQPVLVGRP